MALETIEGTNGNIVSVPTANDKYESITESIAYEIWQLLLTV